MNFRWLTAAGLRATFGAWEHAKPPLTPSSGCPRGFLRRVDRAIKIVELALEKWGAPVFVRHEIVQ